MVRPLREKTILNHIETITHNFLKHQDLEDLNTDAHNVSLDLNIERSNVSRVLNRLHRENLLIKIQGRPTLFLTRSTLKDAYPESYFASVIPSKNDFLQHFNTQNTTGLNRFTSDFDSLIGAHENEALYETVQHARAFVRYPLHRFNMLIYGEPSTGKSTLIQAIHKTGFADQGYSDKLFEFDLCTYSHNLEKLKEEITSSGDVHATSLVVLHNPSQLEQNALTSLLGYLETMQRDGDQTKKQFIFTDTHNCPALTPFVTYTLHTPSFDTRTLKEKVEYVLMLFQNEADALSRTLYVSKNVFSCYVMSHYAYNLNGLRREIQYAVSRALYKHNDTRNTVIDIDLEDLSDTLLNNITNVTNHLNHLDTILHFVNEQNFYFVPNLPSQAFITLHNSTLDAHNTLHDYHSLETLSSYVRKQLRNAHENEITTIKSIHIRDIYDLIYSAIQNSLNLPDPLIYSLLVHLKSVIQNVQSKQYKQRYVNDNDFIRPEILALSQKIAKKCEQAFSISLPTIELNYIQAYLSSAHYQTKFGTIPLIIVSHSHQIAKSYQSYLDTLKFSVSINTFRYDQANHDEAIPTLISKIKNNIDHEKGVVIITDIDSLSTAGETFKKANLNTRILAPLTLQGLIQACSVAENNDATLDDFNYLTSMVPKAHTLHLPSKFLHDISLKLLSESLVFLDSQKSTALLTTVLTNIYQALDYPASDDLAIRFIHHCSFMIERVLRNEPLTVKNISQTISKDPERFRVIEENFSIINNQFGITIPQSELAMVTEIFSPLMPES